MRIADDLLFYSITALRIRAGDVVAQSMRFQAHGFALKIAFLFVKEGFTISDQELGIANLRAVDGGVIDFCEDAHGHCKPDPAGGRIRGSNAILRAGSPCGMDAGRSKSAVASTPLIASHERSRPQAPVQPGPARFLFSYIFPSSADGP